MIISKEAEVDLADARRWYEAQRQGLGGDFVRRVERTLGQIDLMPEAYSIIEQNVRRAKLQKFPYLVYYTIVDGEVVIIAVLHGHRDPGQWKSRV